MSVAVMLQALGWVSVVGLVAVHLLIQHGRLRPDGPAYRIAGCGAASCVVAASAAERIWPVAVLGLLWLRIEVFGHRHHVPAPGATPEPAGGPASSPAPAPGRMPPFLVGAMARDKQRPASESPGSKTGPPAGARQPPVPAQPSHPHLPHPHLPHLPHPHLDRRAVDRVFKIEMGIVIVIAVVLFGIWAEQQRDSFRTTTDHVVCNWIEGC